MSATIHTHTATASHTHTATASHTHTATASQASTQASNRKASPAPRLAPALAALALAAAAPLALAQLILEEVIVTAQKRAESLQDVPISVSALQGEKIDGAGISNMAALADYVPNLYIADAPVNTNIYMRGMGSGNNQAFEQSVGMYIDGIYMGRGRQYRAPFMDIDRVEVLRGPQGTLFGKNTVAGAVSVITATPSLDEATNGAITLAAETNRGRIAEGFISGAVTDTLALRGAFKRRENGGYAKNVYLNEKEPEIDEKVLRLSAFLQPNDTLDVTLKYAYSEYERVGAASGVDVYLDTAQRAEIVPNRSPFASAAYAIMDAAFPNFGEQIARDFAYSKDNNLGAPDGEPGVDIGRYPEGSENDNDNWSLNLNYYIGDYTFTSVTGYSTYTYRDGCDCDWLPLVFIARDDDQDFDQISQEFRITSPSGGFLEYIAGLYLEKNTVEYDRAVTIDASLGGLYQQPVRDAEGNLLTTFTSLATAISAQTIQRASSLAPLGQYTANHLRRNHYYKVDSDSWAIFAQGTLNLREDLRLTLGLRYTEEDKVVHSEQFLSDDVTGLDTPTDSYWAARIYATIFDTYAYNYNEDRDTDDLLPQINLQWDVADNSMLYAAYSEGFKSGGFTGADDGAPGGVAPGAFNCLPVGIATGMPIDEVDFDGSTCYDRTRPSGDFEFEDEEVIALEVGGKHTLLGGGMTLNWALFHTEYDNLQTSIFKGVGFGVTNAAEVTVQGFEFDMLWQASEALRVGLNGAWLDAEFDSYPTAPCTAAQLDYTMALDVGRMDEDGEPAPVDISCGVAGGAATAMFTAEEARGLESGLAGLGLELRDVDGEQTIVNVVDGSSTTFAPEYSASLFWDYIQPAGNNMEFFAGGEFNYSDNYFTQGDLDPVDVAKSHLKTNLRLGLRGLDGSWEVTLYGRNITDEQVKYGFDVPVLAGSHGGQYDEGEVYGARFRYNFQ